MSDQLYPSDFTPHSNIKVWWTCNKGHDYLATIGHRARGQGCPYCSGHQVCKDNCLSTLNPELSKEWNYKKNDKLTPNDVTLGSHKKVWWICNKGHEWKANLSNRSKGRGCPYCSGHRVCNDNCLATLNPELSKEWNYKKNGKLTPNDVNLGSNKKVWWICKKGHEWEAMINSRNGNGCECPYCSGRRARLDNCLSILNPKLAKEWNYKKNGTLTPNDVKCGSGKKVWWKCKKGHEWDAIICDRSNGNSCPYCSGHQVCKDNSLATLNPKLAKEWNYKKNENLTPNDVTRGCHKKVWWKCKNGHEWNAEIKSRAIGGNGCKICSGRKKI